jgi:site-specific DNA-methyltransferase (adenine-specific)
MTKTLCPNCKVNNLSWSGKLNQYYCATTGCGHTEQKYQLIEGDCLDTMEQMVLKESFDCVFMDPPDNIGLKYKKYKDRRPREEYLDWLESVIITACALAPIVWVSFNSKWIFDLGRMVCDFPKGWKVRPCVQTFTFGQARNDDMGYFHRPLWRFMREGATIYPDQTRVESWRLKNGDKRANPDGVVPGDWFDFPRVTGNSKQRRKYHPTQLNEGLVDRCIQLSTKPGGRVLDPFAGTGTTLRVCKRLDRSCTLVELDPFYCEELRKEHAEIRI